MLYPFVDSSVNNVLLQSPEKTYHSLLEFISTPKLKLRFS